MDFTEALTVAIPSVLGAGGLGALLNTYVTRRKNDQGSDAKVREDLRAILKEERTETHRCEEKVEAMSKELMASRISEARCDARLSSLEVQQAEWRQATLKAYLDNGGKSIPPKGSELG